MTRGDTPRDDAERIWLAAIRAADPVHLLAALPDGALGLPARGRVIVVGGGKAAAGMAGAVAARLAAAGVPPAAVSGLVSVPEGCGARVPGIEIRETRPAGVNLPTAAVVEATEAMLGLVASASAADLVVALVTGGGSALLAAPASGVGLGEKVAVSRFLSAAGAGIEALNTVRRAASRVKAGGLARACRAGRMAVLVLSDVIGDPLDLIASGPCMPAPADPRAALAVLARFGATGAGVAPRLVALLGRAAASPPPARPADTGPEWTTPAGCRVAHRIVGSNATAVDAGAAAAVASGYEVERRHADPGSSESVADAGATGRRLAAEARALAARARATGRPRALVEGGEATVRVPADHGRGGRNQQTVLAALEACAAGGWPEGTVIASIGTDGEDGPTDAAGAWADARVAGIVHADRPALDRALARCDALPLLGAAGGIVRTGPTGTNVADVRIILARP